MILLGVCGSLRRGSYNRLLLGAAAQRQLSDPDQRTALATLVDQLLKTTSPVQNGASYRDAPALG